MDQLYLMTVYVAVAEAESFNGGARKLGMSPPAVTRAVATLESRLKVKLLQRTTRYVRMTEVGQRYLQDAKRIMGEVEAADAAAMGVNAEPSGLLAVTAPVQFGKMFIAPLIVQYLKLYPATEVNAMFLDRVVNLIEEGLDVGVRIGELADSSMQAIRVGQVRRVLCASPGYLAQYGEPRIPEDLLQHHIVAANTVSPSNDWKFNYATGINSLRLKPRLSVSSVDAALATIKQDFGIARLMSYQVAPDIKNGALQRLLADYELPPLPIHVVHREGRYATAKIRAFIDLLVASLRADSSLQ